MCSLLQRTGNCGLNAGRARKWSTGFRGSLRPTPTVTTTATRRWPMVGITVLDMLRQRCLSLRPQSGGADVSTSAVASTSPRLPMTGSQCCPPQGATPDSSWRRPGQEVEQGAKSGHDESGLYTSVGDGTNTRVRWGGRARMRCAICRPQFSWCWTTRGHSTPVDRKAQAAASTKLYSRYATRQGKHLK